jgi:hypothetical protein
MVPYHVLFKTASGFTLWRDEFLAVSDADAVALTDAMLENASEYASFELWQEMRRLSGGKIERRDARPCKAGASLAGGRDLASTHDANLLGEEALVSAAAGDL